MKNNRLDNWTHENDSFLVETVLKYIREGGKQIIAFEDAGKQLERTAAACGFRWNSVLRHKYKQAFLAAKKQRLELKREPKNEKEKGDSLPSVSVEKETIITPKDISEIKIKEYQGQRVVTFKDIDEVHGRPEGTAKRNFITNQKHLVEGEDYFLLTQKDEFRTLETIEIPNRGLTIFTESGYLMLVKSFTDDIAWEVQRKLVKSYFKVKEMSKSDIPKIPTSFAEALRLAADLEEQNEKLKLQNQQKETEILMLEQQVADYEPKISYLDKILESKDTMIVSQIAEDYGLTAQALNKILHEEKVQYKLNGQWLLYSEHKGKGYTESKTNTFVKTNGETGTSLQTRWTQKGRLFIHDILTKLGIIPLMDREEKEA